MPLMRALILTGAGISSHAAVLGVDDDMSRLEMPA